MDFATLYEDDIEGWAEAQVAALRRLAVIPGPWSNAIDWENVIEEIEDLGRRDRKSAASLLRNALAHALKVSAEPDSLSADHWRKEVTNFLEQAREAFRNSMRQRIDVDQIWRESVKSAENALGKDVSLRPLRLPDTCPFTLNELTRADLSAGEVLAKVSAASGRPS